MWRSQLVGCDRVPLVRAPLWRQPDANKRIRAVPSKRAIATDFFAARRLLPQTISLTPQKIVISTPGAFNLSQQEEEIPWNKVHREAADRCAARL